jgi:hypothetical protein
MKKQVKVYIDGMEYTQSSMVCSQVRKHFKDLDSEIEVVGKSFLTDLYQDLVKEGTSVFVQNKYTPIIRNLREEKHENDILLFFLVPKDIGQMFFGEDIPFYYNDLCLFFRQINQSMVFYGLDIKIVEIEQEDKIYDIRDKILKQIN